MYGGCVAFLLLNAASMQVSSCCPFSPAEVFPKLWQPPTGLGRWVVSLVSSLMAVGVFQQLSVGFPLLPPSYSLGLL